MYKTGGNTRNIKAARIAAAVMGLVMLAVVLLSASYIAAEANHDCIGENCQVCACMRRCENNIRQMGGGAVAQTVFVLLSVLILLLPLCNDTGFSQATLVAQKVRLNN